MWPNTQFPADLITFAEEILNGKFNFLCSVLNHVIKNIAILIEKIKIIALKILKLYITEDDIFDLFYLPNHLEKFTNYLNSKHKNIKFIYEKECS